MKLDASMQPISEEMANKIYDVLVVHASAPNTERDRKWFVDSVSVNACPEPSHEHRFGGTLNPGAKFYNNWGVFVSCYQEHLTARKEEIIRRCHEEFRKLGLEVRD